MCHNISDADHADTDLKEKESAGKHTHTHTHTHTHNRQSYPSVQLNAKMWLWNGKLITHP